MSKKTIAILGSTGSIGKQTLDIVRDNDQFQVCAMAAGGKWETLAKQVEEFHPKFVALADEKSADKLAKKLSPGIKLIRGEDAMSQMIRQARPDIVVTAIVGSAGLAPTMAAIECGSRLAIANKETLVMAGQIVMPAAKRAGIEILPVDSEHSAIFQCLLAGRIDQVDRVIITASGGALRDWEDAHIENATVADALNHPTWSMGPKITVDSATMMNKALEVVEAHWLFNLPAERIAVLQHPQSIIHAMVEYADGSCIAQMGMPDMRTPIAIALGWPSRLPKPDNRMDLAAIGKLTFKPLSKRFARAVELGYQAIRRGGSAGAVMNAANEAAVEAFLAGKIPFGKIVPTVEAVLNHTNTEGPVTLDSLIAADRHARQQVQAMIK